MHEIGIRLLGMRKKIVCVSLLIIIGLFIGACIYRYKTRILYTETVLFASHGENDINYRIPGIVTLDSGMMIAYCEKRVGKADWGDIDIVYRISEDGVHWGEETVLAGNGENVTYNNPIMIVDDRSVIHCIFCREYGVGPFGGVYYVRSKNGMDWTSPVDISEDTLPGYRNVIGTGPGHGICLQDGALIVPVWMVPKEYGEEEKSHHPSVVSTLYSKDYGETWEIGEILKGNESVVSPNESTLLELSDGRIMINARNESENQLRAIAFSPDGISDWSELELDKQMQDPGCFGSLTRYDGSTILFSNVDDLEERNNISIKVSEDDGKTWEEKKRFVQKIGGYSDINVVNNKMICLLAEKEDENGRYIISYHSFNMRWLLNTDG